ncbi:MAG: hypothetical protein M1828_000071 [Chrysothrix sp. TS-e1954]|nr:MAG: hypothetical protein M1828_000071 [Chrysothrix sp. TS-e1954]
MTLETSSWAPPTHHTALRTTKSANSTPSRTPFQPQPRHPLSTAPNNNHTQLPQTPPTTPPTHTSLTGPPPSRSYPSPQLARISRLLRRLRWKAASLTCSYARAASAVHGIVPNSHDVMGLLSEPGNAAELGNMAESMFKVDFFEFYVLLERVLVLLLEAVGVDVEGAARGGAALGGGAASGTGMSGCSGKSVRDLGSSKYASLLPATANPQLQHAKPPGQTQTETQAQAQAPAPIYTTRHTALPTHPHTHPQHTFHATLLSHLDSPRNPLHPHLGTNEPRHYLHLAKEFRNRWKDADADSNLLGDDPKSREIRGEPERHMRLLEMFDLPNMLRFILGGLEGAREVVGERESFAGVASRREGRTEGEGEGEGDAPWEAVGDPMEWEMD